MTPKELEQLEKKSIYALRINDDIKSSAINNYLNNLTKVIKMSAKNKDLMILVTEDSARSKSPKKYP